MSELRAILFSNNAASLLAVAVNDSETVIQVASGDGALYPSPVAGEIFKVTLQNITTGDLEICNCTSRSGDLLTVEREVEGTDAFEFPIGTLVHNRITAEALQHVVDDSRQIGINEQTGASYTLALTDMGKVVERNRATANTVTVPPNSGVAIPVNSVCLIRQMGVGATSIVAGVGVTLVTPATLDLATRYAVASLHKRDTNVWAVEGRLS